MMPPSGQERRILVLADSLAFHGPGGQVRPSHPGLYQNVSARLLGEDVSVDLVARPGYTARDAWWAVTKDPVVWGEYLPRADAVVLSVGHMDQLPAALPTWMRESIPFIRPGALRRGVRRAYLAAAPRVIAWSDGRMAQLSPVASNHYLSRLVTGVRHVRGDLPMVRLLPAPYGSRLYPSARPHLPAVRAARQWCRRHDVPGIDLDGLVPPGPWNPDGLHWDWPPHRRVGEALAAALVAAGLTRGARAGAP